MWGKCWLSISMYNWAIILDQKIWTDNITWGTPLWRLRSFRWNGRNWSKMLIIFYSAARSVIFPSILCGFLWRKSKSWGWWAGWCSWCWVNALAPAGDSHSILKSFYGLSFNRIINYEIIWVSIVWLIMKSYVLWTASQTLSSGRKMTQAQGSCYDTFKNQVTTNAKKNNQVWYPGVLL